MDINTLQQYYRTAYCNFRRNGRKNKILLLFLSIPAVIFAYYDVDRRWAYYEWDFPHEYLYYLCLIMLGMISITILTMNTISFVNTHRVNKLRFHFKKELFNCINEQIPEIKGYRFNHKIHPRYFDDSGLYKSVYTDYIGDDLFHGEYLGSTFEICELHVFKLFKQVFDGLFLRINLHVHSLQPDDMNNRLLAIQTTFKNNYSLKFVFKNSGIIYTTVKIRGKFFEQTNLREIDELGNEIIVLSDIVKMTKRIIDGCQ